MELLGEIVEGYQNSARCIDRPQWSISTDLNSLTLHVTELFPCTYIADQLTSLEATPFTYQTAKLQANPMLMA